MSACIAAFGCGFILGAATLIAACNTARFR
jgi:hypothetical protein